MTRVFLLLHGRAQIVFEHPLYVTLVVVGVQFYTAQMPFHVIW